MTVNRCGQNTSLVYHNKKILKRGLKSIGIGKVECTFAVDVAIALQFTTKLKEKYLK